MTREEFMTAIEAMPLGSIVRFKLLNWWCEADVRVIAPHISLLPLPTKRSEIFDPRILTGEKIMKRFVVTFWFFALAILFVSAGSLLLEMEKTSGQGLLTAVGYVLHGAAVVCATVAAVLSFKLRRR